MPRNTFNTTIEIPSTLRDDIKKLASKEAQKLSIPRLSSKDYLVRLISKEKSKHEKN
jgi:hypothetical protein